MTEPYRDVAVPPQPLPRQNLHVGTGDVPSAVPARLAAVLPLILVAALAIATAFFRLGSKGLWGDEVWQVTWARQQSLVQTFLRFRVPPDLSLHFILVQLATDINTSPFFVRLPSALLGAATPPVLFVLGRRAVGAYPALIGAMFLAIAPYHVWYSQDARPYAGLAFYSLLSLYFLWRWVERPSGWKAAALAAALCLDLYDHLFAMFPILIEIAAIVAWTVVTLRGTRAGSQERAKCLRSLLTLATALAIAALACFPLYPGISSYLFAQKGGSATPSLQFLHDLIVDVFTLFAAGSGWAGIVTSALFIVGVIMGMYGRRWFAALALAWIAVPIALLWLSRPQHMFVPRYFLFMQPIYWLMIASGVIQIGILAVRVAGTCHYRITSRARYLPSALVIAILLAATLPPTWYSYWVEKTNNWSALCEYLNKHVQTGDAITGNLWSTSVVATYCFNQQFFASTPQDVAVTPDGNWPIGQFTHSGRNAWYLAIGAGSEPPYVAQHYAEVSQASWDQPGLIDAGYYDNRLLYPQAEQSAVLYHYLMRQPPQFVQFHDTKGTAVSPTWPDYAAIGANGSYEVHLGLTARGPRILQISYLAGPEYQLLVDGRPVALFADATRAGQWLTRKFMLPPGVGSDFLIEVRNPGTQTAAISRVGVSYAG